MTIDNTGTNVIIDPDKGYYVSLRQCLIGNSTDASKFKHDVLVCFVYLFTGITDDSYRTNDLKSGDNTYGSGSGIKHCISPIQYICSVVV